MSGTRMRRRAAVLSAVLLAAGLPAGAVAADEPAHQRPSTLIGSWQMSGPKIDPGVVLRLGDGDVRAEEGRCTSGGGWRALPTGELFVYLWGTGGDGTCMTHAWPLTTVTGFRTDGRNQELLDADGEVVALLEPLGPPGKPYVPAERRAELDTAPAPVPPGLEPATEERLGGNWTLGGAPRRGAPSLGLRDPWWTASDGCWGTGGVWRAGGAGRLMVLGFASSMVPSCRVPTVPVPVGKWMRRAATAGFAGDALVLVDRQGVVLGSLVRATG